MDETRRSEAKHRPELKGTRRLWLKRPESLNEWDRENFDYLMQLELKTGRAFAFKEAFRHFFEQKTRKRAKAFLESWTPAEAENPRAGLEGAA